MNGEQFKIIVLHLQNVPKDICSIWVFRQKTGILSFMQDLEKNGPLFATQYLQLTVIVHTYTFSLLKVGYFQNDFS